MTVETRPKLTQLCFSCFFSIIKTNKTQTLNQLSCRVGQIITVNFGIGPITNKRMINIKLFFIYYPNSKVVRRSKDLKMLKLNVSFFVVVFILALSRHQITPPHYFYPFTPERGKKK